MKAFINWVDDRTGIRGFVNEALYENIPGGSRWRYVWGSTLVFAFTVQLITGIFLWMAYSPNSKGAWESVYFIQFEMQGGWLLRGLHHVMAQAMIVLLALHFLQIVIDGAYRAPREFNFWTGLILMKIVLGLSLTGYLLPWDQKGYWATKVATNLAGLVPIFGSEIQKLAVGGTDYGHATLTRFFALHAGVLPGLLIFFLVLHMALFRRQGIHAKDADRRPAAYFWPDQVLKDAVACLAVLAVVMLFVLKGFYLDTHSAPGVPLEAHLGAELGAPADPSTPYSAARPEWYFLFLFEFLKWFPGEREIFGAIIIPGIVMLALFLMPFIGRWKLGHGFNVAMVLALLGGAGFLTATAMYKDRKSESYAEAVETAEQNAIRAIQLARAPRGIPDGGAIALLRDDPKTQGPVLFTTHCGSCHAYGEAEGLWGLDDVRGKGLKPPAEISAPNLYKIGTTEWIAAFLNPKELTLPGYGGEVSELPPINSLHFFGGTEQAEGEMADYITSTMADEDEWTPEQIQAVVTALAAESGIEENLDQEQIALGRELLQDDSRCAMCHEFGEENFSAYAPQLTGYGSRQWLIDFISNPADPRFYGDNNDRMPAFYHDPHAPLENRITKKDLELIVDWLRTDWYEPEAEPHSEEPAEGEPPTEESPGQPPAPEEEMPAEEAPAEDPASEPPAEDTPAEPTPEPEPEDESSGEDSSS
ncbi:MAG: cytochrome b N-terminal domain-containing protein [Pirellulaceae bacterium]